MCLVFCCDYIIPYIGSVLLFYFANLVKKFGFSGVRSLSYDNVIFGWYERCLLSEDERIRNQAADSLFHAFVRKNDYEKAAHYLDYFSLENPERKRKEALVNSKTGKRTEAYRAYEELVYSGYQHIQMVLK